MPLGITKRQHAPKAPRRSLKLFCSNGNHIPRNLIPWSFMQEGKTIGGWSKLVHRTNRKPRS